MMGDYAKKVFTTGEFAKLCRTTKDTLLHYDHIGLLKPQIVEENSYRKYTSEQFFEFDLIRVLRQAGSSLQEIKQYREHYDTQHFLGLMRKQRRQLAEQREKIQQMERMLDNTIEMTEWALKVPYDKPRVEHQEEELLMQVRLKPGEGDSAAGSALRLAELFAKCERLHLADKFPLGSIILREQVLAGSEDESYFFSPVSQEEVQEEEVFCKPEGFYAVIVHRGTYDSFSEAYQRLLDYIRERGLTICGNAYIFDLVSYLASNIEEKYIVQICIQVEAGCGSCTPQVSPEDNGNGFTNLS